MGLFGVFATSGSGLATHRALLEAVSDNEANVKTVRSPSEAAFQARYIVAQTRPGGGVDAAGVVFGNPEGKLLQDPHHPLADAAGNVRAPDMDLGEQMTSLLMAQRGYQANLAVIERARDAYQRALDIGG